MKDTPLQSGPAMVRIDGRLVRQLREEKGLTQLYLATAVEVTTDTISRWENRHYQSVKMENALRLAAALEVELDVILEGEQEQFATPEGAKSPSAFGDWRRRGILLLALVAILGGTIALFVSSRQGQTDLASLLSASRKTPTHAMPGSPFPVVITVETSAAPLSVVIRESLPAGVQITSSSATLQPLDKVELKWIVKHMAGQQRFGYMVTATGRESLHFQGTVTTRAGRDKEIIIGGRQSLALAPFHWADSNQDGIISDDEILVVYDDFDDVAGLDVNVELVEEMWMGSGYRWNQDKAEFEIMP